MVEQINYNYDNLYALDTNGRPIFIRDAVSGKKGYYCRGCKFPMQAVKQTIVGRRSFFRHDVKDVNIERKCTYSSESYRHQLAKEFLQLSKMVRVPPVYKYSLNNKEKIKIQLLPARTIFADTVSNECPFYETEDGKVIWGKGQGEKKNLLIRPDVAFFDSSGHPILLIELCASHAVDDDKRVKLYRLGIDTIQIKIPIDSPESITDALKRSQFTKWIFNSYENNADFFSVSGGNHEDLSSDDIEQRKLLKESFTCRQAIIRNLIRSITKSLGGEQYLGVTGDFKREIRRVESNTKQFEKQWGELQERIREEVSAKYATEENIFRIEEAAVDTAKDDLEGRYYKKREELDRTTTKLIKGNTEFQRLIGEKREQLIREEKDIDEQIARLERGLDKEYNEERIESFQPDSFERRIQEEIRNIEAEIERVEKQIQFLPAEFERNTTELRNEFSAKEDDFGPTVSAIQQGIIDMQGKYEGDRNKFIEQFETDKERFTTLTLQDYHKFDADFGRELKNLYSQLSLYKDFHLLQLNLKRVRTAISAINDATYKNWDN